MAKNRYHFNAKTLKFEKARVTLKERALKVLSFLFTTFAFAALVIFLAYNLLESPMEKMQQRELAFVKVQYEILNDRLDQLALVLQDMQDRDDNIYRVIFEREPIPSAIRKAGFGGSDRYANLRGFKNSDIAISTSQKLDVIASQLYVQSKSFDEVFDMAKNKEKMLASLPAIQPVSNKDLRRIGSYFGYRTDPFYKIIKLHEGLDFSAPVGTEIYATGDGVVVNVERSRIGYGNHVVIDHGYGFKTLYAHLSKFEARRGEKVKRGQIIGYVGNTGKSTSPHLHYEVHRNGRPVDPIHYLFNDISPEEYELLIGLSSRPGQSMD
ncbi:MAG: M23 family metallopeptidase [Bacteroidales bacterium]|nr:M23 family metallopeptidase [Bacteroidales bacterium]MDZ4203555.1 M23 family metallopeptidase [Bacteroidales bacterium]